MIIACYLILLILIAAATLGGPLFLLLRGTWLAKYLVELSVLLLPALIVVGVSLLGYVHAPKASPTLLVVLVTAGLLVTLTVAVRHRPQLVAATRLNGPRLALVLVTGLVAGLVVVPRQVAENQLGYLEFMNGEFLNYSQFATFSMGRQHSDLPTAFIRSHQSYRDGPDFINPAVSLLTYSQPVDIVQLVSAFFRLGLTCLCALVVWELRLPSRSGALISLLLLLGLVCYPLDIYAFQLSFMGANAAIGMFALLLMLLALVEKIPPKLFLVLFVWANLHLLITYPEIMPFLKISELAFFLERWSGRSHLRWSLPLGNVLVLLINPLLVVRKVIYIRTILGGTAGWNILCNPLESTAQYLRHLVGLEYNFIPSPFALAPALVLAAALLLAGVGLWALARMADRLGGLRAVWLLPLGFAWFHLAPLVVPPAPGVGMHFYGAAKFMLLWTWIIPIAFALALSTLRTLPRQALFAGFLAIYTAAHLVVLAHAISFQLKLPTFYSQELAAKVVEQVKRSGSKPIILTEQTIPLWYWFQVLDSAGQTPVILTQTQANLLARAPTAQFTAPEPGSWPHGRIAAVQPTKLLWFANHYITIEAAESPDAFTHKAGDLHLNFGQVLCAAPQVSLRAATLAAPAPALLTTP